MMWHRAPVARLVIPFIAGIVLARYIVPPLTVLWAAIGGCLLAQAWMVAAGKNRQAKLSLAAGPGIWAFAAMALCGMLAVYYSSQLHHPHHIQHAGQYSNVLVRLTDEPEEKNKTWRATVQVVQVYKDSTWQPAIGKLIVYLNKTGYDNTLQYGDYLLVNRPAEAIPPPQNPGEFDYKAYLARQNIYGQVFLKQGQYSKTAINKANPLYSMAFACRKHFSYVLGTYIKDTATLGVASALILGVRNQLGDDLTTAYARTGTMHILAVSGLHVGVIYIVLGVLLGFLSRFKRGAVIKAIIILMLLWLYALITGLSPSITRATIMFSFVLVGDAFRRKITIYNSLAASALFILCLDANVLYNVGFQLSYLAVLGIAALQQPIYWLFNFTNWFIDNVWKLTSVSIAAQVAVFPLCIYYFHQFPVYFLIANLLVVPLGMCILYLGILLFVLSPIAFLAAWVGKLLHYAVWLCNYVVMVIERLPFSYTDNLYLSTAGTLLVYLAIGFLLIYIAVKKYPALIASLSCVVLLAGLSFYRDYNNRLVKEFTIYSLPPGQRAISYIEAGHAWLWADTAVSKDTKTYSQKINPHFILRGVKDVTFLHGDSINVSAKNFSISQGRFIALQQLKMVLLDSAHEIHTLPFIYWDIAILGHNARVSLEDINARTIVADNTNSLYKVQQWEQQAKATGKDICAIPLKGAYNLKLDQ